MFPSPHSRLGRARRRGATTLRRAETTHFGSEAIQVGQRDPDEFCRPIFSDRPVQEVIKMTADRSTIPKSEQPPALLRSLRLRLRAISPTSHASSVSKHSGSWRKSGRAECYLSVRAEHRPPAPRRGSALPASHSLRGLRRLCLLHNRFLDRKSNHQYNPAQRRPDTTRTRGHVVSVYLEHRRRTNTTQVVHAR
jgi:hypothetical protein